MSEITKDLNGEVKAWQTRRLEAIWPIVFRDGIVVHIRGEAGRVSEHTMYVAPGDNGEGRKELLGLWLNETEGAKFWLSCLTDLKNRGVNDLFEASKKWTKPIPKWKDARNHFAILFEDRLPKHLN